MKFIILFFGLILSFYAKGVAIPETSHCLSQLLYDSNQLDSRAFQILKTSEIESQENPTKAAVMKLEILLQKIQCPIRESQLRGKVSCHSFPATQVCEIQTGGGVFIISDDYLDHVNIIFNRWD